MSLSQTCGKTADGGVVNVAAEMDAIESSTGMPSVGADGLVTATVHQVNQDGAGPYKFEVSPSGNMDDWVVSPLLARASPSLGRSLTSISLRSADHDRLQERQSFFSHPDGSCYDAHPLPGGRLRSLAHSSVCPPRSQRTSPSPRPFLLGPVRLSLSLSLRPLLH